MKKITLACVFLLSLSSCGGGGGRSGECAGSPAVCAPSQDTTSSSTPQNESVTSLANICTPNGEKNWVRAHLDDAYLWYDEIVNVPPASYSSASDYFYALLVKSRDRFSFTASQSEMDQFFQSGEEIGYGANLVNTNDRVRVSHTEPNTPAAQQNIQRGAEIIEVNGVPIAEMSEAAKSAALYPSAGATNQFTVLDAGATAARKVQLSAAIITRSPVPKNTIINTADNKKVGYLLFTDHIATAEEPLIAAMMQFQNSGIDDLVLDVRYNGGGYLYIANELASMIAGTAAKNKIFEQLKYNNKHPEKTNSADSKFIFSDTSSLNKPLPQLNLKRVFVLTGADTCSASESIINGLSPFVQVITIGGTTCGKPYGFIQENNCHQAYFAIQFAGVNNIEQGDYTNGFSPTCGAADDLEHALGDTKERLLATALGYRTSGTCPASGLTQSSSAKYTPLVTRQAYRAPWRENRLLK